MLPEAVKTDILIENGLRVSTLIHAGAVSHVTRSFTLIPEILHLASRSRELA